MLLHAEPPNTTLIFYISEVVSDKVSTQNELLMMPAGSGPVECQVKVRHRLF